MDNVTQVSFEYLIVIAMLIVIGALVMVLSKNYFEMSSSMRGTGEGFSQRALEMLK